MKAVLLVFLATFVAATVYPTPGKNVLVVLENNDFKKSHSLFFANLRGILPLCGFIMIEKGCQLSFVSVDDSFEIIKYGESEYDDIFLLLESDKKYNSLNSKTFRSFLDFHGSIFVMFSSDPSSFVRGIAGYAGVEIDPKGSVVVDHFTAVSEPGNLEHTKFQTANYLKVLQSVSLDCRSLAWSEILPLALGLSLIRGRGCESTRTTSMRCLWSLATMQRHRWVTRVSVRTTQRISC